jgi:hypothetical protein
MFFHLMMCFWSFILDLAAISRLTGGERDLEILLLRQQLQIVERRQQRGPHIPRWQKVPLAVLAYRLKQRAANTHEALQASVRLFKPDTLLGWHRELVRRKWTFKQGRRPGRPPIDEELEEWIVRVAQDNSDLGYDKLEGELRKLGFEASSTAIRSPGIIHGCQRVAWPQIRSRRGFLTLRALVGHRREIYES